MLAVRHGISDDVLQEELQDTPNFFVNETRDTLDTASSSQTPDGRLGDSLDVVAKDLAMTLGATLSETLSTFTTARHVFVVIQ